MLGFWGPGLGWPPGCSLQPSRWWTLLAAAPSDQGFSRGAIRWLRSGVSEQTHARLDTFARVTCPEQVVKAASDSEQPSHQGLGSDPETSLCVREEVHFSGSAGSDPGRSPRLSWIDGVSTSTGRLESKSGEEAALGTLCGEVGGPR